MQRTSQESRWSLTRAGYVLALCLTGVVAVGCGESSSYEFAPVSGVVTLDGKPLANGTVSFEPKGGGTGSFGVCDAEGRYVLESINGEDGAVVATHRVAIYSPRNGGKELVPRKYNYDTTLTFDVPPGGTDSADWDLPIK